MIRRMIRILVVPVLGGLPAPTKRSGRAAALARPRNAKRRGRVGDLTPVAADRRKRRLRPAALSSLGAVGVALVLAGCGAASTNSASPAATGARTTPVAPAGAVTTPAGAPANAPTGAAAAAATPKPEVAPNVSAAPAGAPASAATPTPKTTPKAPAAAAPKNPDAGIPQGNGGDADPDNNGGANDGDGAI